MSCPQLNFSPRALRRISRSPHRLSATVIFVRLLDVVLMRCRDVDAKLATVVEEGIASPVYNDKFTFVVPAAEKQLNVTPLNASSRL